MSLEEALTLPNQLAKPIVVHGEQFPTRRAVAAAFGINRATFYGRLRRGYSPEEAVDKEVAVNIPMTLYGKIYPSIGSAATAHNLPYSLVSKRRGRGWSDEEALTIPSGIGTEATYGGKSYKTLKEACEVTGMDPRSASYRLNAGWDIETALDPNAEVDTRKSITINGQNYSTLSDAAREFGLKEITFIKRVRVGWTPEQAAGIEPPPEFQGGQAPIPAKEYIERLKLVHGDNLNFDRSDFGRAQEKIKVECNIDDRNALFWATPNNLLRGRGCPVCKASYGERAIYLWLERHSIEAIREWTDNGLSTSSDKRGRLRFDFYLPNQKALIEYDGLHHFEPVTFGKMAEEDAQQEFERLKFNDAAKDEWAGENGYKLVRIRFDERIEDRLEEEFGG
jgi:hypothetical protein